MVLNTTPAPSTMSFVPPTNVVKRGPSIKDLINDPVPSAPAPQPQSSTQNIEKQEVNVAPAEVPKEPVQVEQESVPVPEPADNNVPKVPDEDPEAFQPFWEKLCDELFAEIPTLHEPLKHYHPTRKENVFTIVVKNDIQEQEINRRNLQVLNYLKEKLDPTIEELQIVVDAEMELKKFILDDNDKINALREQNPDLADFMRTLNLRVKN